MAKRGLSSELILDEAEKMICEKGYDALSVRELAARLEVKPASLYNHISGIRELNVGIAIRAANKMREILEAAVEGKMAEEAFMAGTKAYRQFAMDNPELYKAVIHMPLLNDEDVRRVGMRSFAPIRDIIGLYELSDTDFHNFIRGIRSVMHGFIELTNNGFMQKGNVTQDESYEAIMRTYFDVLKSKAGNKKE